MAALLEAPPSLAAESSVVAAAIHEFARDVRMGLGQPQKTVPSKYLYDAVGSALFEAITLLPEYGLTRADERLLNAHAKQVAEWISTETFVVELGSGSGRKTVPILEALCESQREVSYWPVDVSPNALEQCWKQIGHMEGVSIHPLRRSYLEGIREASSARTRREHMLVLFLGSSIGNFDPDQAAAFLSCIRGVLRAGDALLIGADLVKPPEDLLKAYDDPAGLTAAFNMNLLSRMNRQLGADFDHRNFRHEVRWNPEERRIEMHLSSTAAQTVEIPGADCRARFEEGETIWTESSYKYTRDQMEELAEQNGFTVGAQWVDPMWPFMNALWVV